MIKAEIKGDIFDLQSVADAIQNAQEDVELTINSPGGSALEGMNVARAIMSNAEIKVVANVETMAASAAAVIALSCDKVRMSKMDVLVLHHCWTVAVGNKEDLAQEAEAMAHIDAILEEYLTKHCKDKDDAELIKERMQEGDVWLNAEEAADLFDNVEVIEMPEKALQNSVSLAKLVAEKKAADQEIAKLKAELAELKAEDAPPAEDHEEEGEAEQEPAPQSEPEPVPVAPIKKKQDEYSPDILAIINEVL